MAQGSTIYTKRVWESVQLYSVKCGKCSKWRLIPTKDKYEEIREAIEQYPFSCEAAREWRPEISCDDEADVEQDSNYRWAMDRPSIPQTPYGWQRIIRIRAEGGTKFADVYYVTPFNKRLRSLVEINRYLEEHPDEGLKVEMFSFQSPLPLDGNYVAKRRGRDMTIVPFEGNHSNSRTIAVRRENKDLDYGAPEMGSAHFNY